MPLLASDALQRIRSGQLTLGLGVHHLRGAAVPLLAKAAGFDFLFIDAEHGAIATPEISQIAIAALGMGVVPIVRICAGAMDEGTRALDNGALGLVVPHVDTPEEAQRLVEAFRFAPMGHRSTGGSNAAFGYRPPPTAAAQQSILNSELLIIPMIETPRAVENADAIAAIPGIDALLIGSNDLALEMGIPGQLGHDSIRVRAWVRAWVRARGFDVASGRPIPAPFPPCDTSRPWPTMLPQRARRASSHTLAGAVAQLRPSRQGPGRGSSAPMTGGRSFPA